MSNIGSTAMQTKNKTEPHVPGLGAKQVAFNQGTMGMLDEARNIVENAVGQGAQLNPMIYQYLGLNPTFEDHSSDLSAAQKEFDAAQGQYTEAQKTLSQLQAIPGGKRTPAQKQQLAQLKKHMPALNQALGHAQDAFSKLQSMPKTITGFSKLDPKDIPADSPFSAQNPLFQAQGTEAQRLNEYLKGGQVDPTLTHQYDAAEANLRAKLQQRFGPDYESSSVGQMALQNFARQKNEAFATWNQNMVDKYNALAFGGAGALQQLAGGQIGLWREPESTQIAGGNALSNLANTRISQQQTAQQWALGHAGVSTQANIAGNLVGGLGSLVTTPYDKGGDTLASSAVSGAGKAASAIGSGASDLYNWATGAAAAEGLGAGSEAANAAIGF